MTRSGILITLIILAMLWAIVNSIIPRGTDPRRHSLGKIGDTELGSIKLPYGWDVYRRDTNEQMIRLDFLGRYHGAPWIRVESMVGPIEEPSVSQMERRRFLYGNLFNEAYYDSSLNVTWRQQELTDLDGHKHIIEAHFHSPRNVKLRFVDEDTTREFSSTVEKIVASYSLRAADPPRESGTIADAIPTKPAFTLADVDRKHQAKWALGLLAFFLSLLLLERRMEQKLVDADIAEGQQRRRDALAARLAAQGTPFEDIDNANVDLPDGVQPMDADAAPVPESTGDVRSVSDEDAESLLRESDALKQRKKSDADNAPIPFDD